METPKAHEAGAIAVGSVDEVVQLVEALLVCKGADPRSAL